MIEGPIGDEQARLLREHQLAQPFPSAAASRLLSLLRWVQVAAGEAVIVQDEPGDDLYLVLRGVLGVHIDHCDGTRTEAETVGPGDVIGEMALLTGQSRRATVTAREACDLARLSRADFERAAAEHPQALDVFLQRLLPRLRRSQLIHVLHEVFGALDATMIADLEAHLEWTQLEGGATLFREGDEGDDIYIVVNGRLRVLLDDPYARGGCRLIEEVGRGRIVGELALLTGESRGASVIAVRASDLLRLSKAAFDVLLVRHPHAMLQIARAAAWRLRRQRRPGASDIEGPAVLALIPIRPGGRIGALAARLHNALAKEGAVLCLTSAEVDRRLGRPGIAQTLTADPINESIVGWLDAQQREHRYLMLVADEEDSPWTRRCATQADRVLLVANAADDPSPAPMERALGALKLTARCELVLVHEAGTTRPVNTAAWLASRDVAVHHHVRMDDAADVRRLARRSTGRAVGLVLGGGGARGFAHIGVLRAIAEAGIEVDIVGGTSIGSVIAGAHALGLSTRALMSLARSFASKRQLLDRTLPVVALMRGAKVTAIYQSVYGDARIEDLWTPYFAVSSGLTRAVPVVHAEGPLWQATRASTAVPAIFPPIIGSDREVLVDGSVMNNMPLDVMRAWCEGGTVIGVNPMPIDAKVRDYCCGPSVSGWDALRGKWKLFGSKTRAPSLFGAVMRATEINSANRMRQPAFRALADLLIEPPVGEFPIMEYGAYEPIVEAGYRAASEAIAAWGRPNMSPLASAVAP